MSLLKLSGLAPPFGLMHNCHTKAKRKYGVGLAVVAGHGTTRTPLSPAGRLATLLPHNTVGSGTRPLLRLVGPPHLRPSRSRRKGPWQGPPRSTAGPHNGLVQRGAMHPSGHFNFGVTRPDAQLRHNLPSDRRPCRLCSLWPNEPNR